MVIHDLQDAINLARMFIDAWALPLEISDEVERDVYVPNSYMRAEGVRIYNTFRRHVDDSIFLGFTHPRVVMRNIHGEWECINTSGANGNGVYSLIKGLIELALLPFRRRLHNYFAFHIVAPEDRIGTVYIKARRWADNSWAILLKVYLMEDFEPYRMDLIEVLLTRLDEAESVFPNLMVYARRLLKNNDICAYLEVKGESCSVVVWNWWTQERLVEIPFAGRLTKSVLRKVDAALAYLCV